ncbi:MAG: assimilatory nitrate reductase catalytic subunit [Candidatus Endobugula sp.]
MSAILLPEQSSPQWIKSTCPYCGVGCGIEVKIETPSLVNKMDTPLARVRGDEAHPANYGRLCSKGLALGDTITNEGKLTSPSINGEKTHWNLALDYVADQFQQTIEKYGADSVAFYVSGQLLTEDYYVANKLMKGYIGSANIDTNSRLCMSSSVAGHKRAFGADTVPNCYADIEHTDMIVLTGSNLAWCHPVLYQRLKAAKLAKPHLKIIVIDPRETDTCELADLHLAIQPGTDVALFNGLLNYLHEHQQINTDYVKQYTHDFDAALQTAQEDTGAKGVDFLSLSRTTGLPIAYIETFYQWFAATEKVLTYYSQGVNQSSAGTDKVNSIINCHFATGRIGIEGAGPFSVTGQPNAMGGREVGGLANTLAAHMEFGNNEHHNTVSEFWKTTNLAKKPGLKAIEMFDAIADGKIKAVWIMATNPVVSLPNSNKIKQALERCPLVVVSDCIADTDTTRCANVLLPAKGWAEKSGTVTNSERRISRQRSLIASSSDVVNERLSGAKADWWIMCQVALRMGYNGFNFTSEADIFREYAQMTAFNNNGSRDLDLGALAALSDKEYDNLLPQQWPLEKGSPVDDGTSVSQKRFFSQGQFYTPSHKGNFIPVSYRQPASSISKEYPMVLNTGRIRDQWHTMTRTGLSSKLGGHKPEPYVQLHPQDARCFNLKDGDIAEVYNTFGKVKARVLLSNEMKAGHLFIPIHWTDVGSSHGKVCNIVSPEVDPISAQPEAKFTPVAIKVWNYTSEALLLSREPIETTAFDYWVRRRVNGGYLYSIAQSAKESQASLLSAIQSLCQLEGDNTRIEFNDTSQQQFRCATMIQGELNTLYVIAPSLCDTDYAWLDKLLSKELDVDSQRSILSGKPTAALISGKQICACKQVGELSIINAIQEGADSVESIGGCTGAGTGCGSCIPELSQLLNNHQLSVAI